ncbi:MAG: hypothetical protein JRF47_09695 [Deltaproteobacteria bacterium]|nr:hypothetical protein [Deltaproteobacteria bacterium]
MTKSKILNCHPSRKSSWKSIAAILMICLPILFACSHTQKILVPPRIDLKTYKAIGVIDFSSAAKSDLCEYLTQNYIQTVQSAQPGVRFLELGSKEHVLAHVSRKELDLEAIKSIGGAYHVDALIFGQFSATDPKPHVRLSSTWQSMQAGAVVEASLITKIWETDSGVILWTNSTASITKIWETDSGVILWTNSTARKKKVAGLYANTNGDIKFGASDPEEAYGHLVPELVYANTADFRSYYEYRKVR